MHHWGRIGTDNLLLPAFQSRDRKLPVRRQRQGHADSEGEIPLTRSSKAGKPSHLLFGWLPERDEYFFYRAGGGTGRLPCEGTKTGKVPKARNSGSASGMTTQ